LFDPSIHNHCAINSDGQSAATRSIRSRPLGRRRRRVAHPHAHGLTFFRKEKKTLHGTDKITRCLVRRPGDRSSAMVVICAHSRQAKAVGARKQARPVRRRVCRWSSVGAQLVRLLPKSRAAAALSRASAAGFASQAIPSRPLGWPGANAAPFSGPSPHRFARSQHSRSWAPRVSTDCLAKSQFLWVKAALAEDKLTVPGDDKQPIAPRPAGPGITANKLDASASPFVSIHPSLLPPLFHPAAGRQNRQGSSRGTPHGPVRASESLGILPSQW
jgi:hypothetical protein